jgi:hypothetical protein
MSRWFGPAGAPVLESDLQPIGTDRVSGVVANRLTVPLQDALLVFGKQVYLLGDIAPGASLRIVPGVQVDRNLSGLLKDKMSRMLPDSGGSSNPSRINRADLLLEIMFHESQSFLSSERTVSNDPLGYLDLSGQLALDRPMLIARIQRPGTSLVLGNAPSSPKINQTTLVRVILPLKPVKSPG